MQMQKVALILVVMFPCSEAYAQRVESREISILVNGAVEFVLEDPLGRHSGFDPKLNRRYDEINKSYGKNEVDSENPNVEPPEPASEFITSDPLNGNYKLVLYGTKLSNYKLYVTLIRFFDKLTDSVDGKSFEFIGVIDSGATVQYQFEYNSTLNAPLIAKKVVEGLILLQDLDNCLKLGMIKNQGLYTSLKQKATNAIRQHAKGQDKSAVNLLQAFLNEVNAQTEKGLNKDAAAILTEDAEALIQQWQK